MTLKYTAPKLTKYGKIREFIQAGSVELAKGDVTGDGVEDTLFDTDRDGVGDVVIGGANGGQTPVVRTIAASGFSNNDSYDGDGDGLAGIRHRTRKGTMFRLSSGSNTLEPATDDGWDDPDRD